MIFAAIFAAPIEVTTDTIEAARGRSHHSLIEFYSSTCAPCKQLKPHQLGVRVAALEKGAR